MVSNNHIQPSFWPQEMSPQMVAAVVDCGESSTKTFRWWNMKSPSLSWTMIDPGVKSVKSQGIFWHHFSTCWNLSLMWRTRWGTVEAVAAQKKGMSAEWWKGDRIKQFNGATSLYQRAIFAITKCECMIWKIWLSRPSLEVSMALAFSFLVGQDGPGSFYTFKTFYCLLDSLEPGSPLSTSTENAFVCLKVSFASAQSLFMGPWPEVDLLDDWRGRQVVKLSGWSLESMFKII